MTTTTVPERMVVSATVKSWAEEADGFKFELAIPSFRSDYPITIDRVPAALAAQLPPREELYSLVVLRRALKSQRDGQPYSGRFPRHYYWGLEGLASAQDLAVKAQEADPLEDREHRIVRGTALTQAVAFCAAFSKDSPGLTPNDVLGVAGIFYAWLWDGPQARQEAQDEGDRAAAPATGAAKVPVAKGAPAPSVGVAGGLGVKDAREELPVGAPVWPEVEPEERGKAITNDDWDKVSGMRKGRGVSQQAFGAWCRGKWGLRYGQVVRRRDLQTMVAWLSEQAKTTTKPGS